MLKTEVSALMDGEMDVAEASHVFGALKNNDAIRGEWASFHLIGAAMRKEQRLDVDITASVMRALDTEPTVLAPVLSRSSISWRRYGPMGSLLALAASAAGVALVAWVALGEAPAALPGGSGSSTIATVASKAVITPPDRGKELRDYLLAHHAHAPMVTMAEGTRYVRTVSMEREKP